MIENLGLKNSGASLLQVMSRDGDDTTQRSIADTLKDCLALGAELWDTPMVQAQAGPQAKIMQRIREGQEKIHGSVRAPSSPPASRLLRRVTRTLLTHAHTHTHTPWTLPAAPSLALGCSARCPTPASPYHVLSFGSRLRATTLASSKGDTTMATLANKRPGCG